jgi:holdfast attachment protein HfaA
MLKIAGMTLGLTMMAAPVFAGESANQLDGFNVPYGASSIDQDRTTFNPSSRDANGNRVIVNGRFVNGDVNSVPWTRGGARQGFSRVNAQAIGNQINVVTSGRWNTVIVDSTQINNGNQQAIVSGSTEELNGSITLGGGR